MTEISPETRRAARALGERLAAAGRDDAPRRASFTDVGTIEEVMADGTALVSYRGGTIGPLPMTCDCVCATRGRACVIAIDGPIVRVIGILARSSSDFPMPAATAAALGGVKVGSGLAVADDGTLSVDNGAYVKLLWSGCTQSAVTLAAPLSGYRAIAVTIGGSDGVDEGTTLVWAPDGRTFDVTAAFVVGTSDFRVMRMRFKASGSTIAPTVVDGQNVDGYTSSNAFLHSVVGIA